MARMSLNVATSRFPWVLLLIAFVIVCSIWTLNPSYDSIAAQFDELTPERLKVPSYDDNNPADAAAVKAALGQVPSLPVTPTTGSASSTEASPVSEPTLITYVYAETKTARVNLQFFLDHALHDKADFIFIFNNPTDMKEKVPKKDNIKIVERDNTCFDLGSHSEVLKKDDLYKKYKKFVLMNASIRGPFLPYWSRDCWTDMYLSRITETNKLVGMTSNCWPQFHIQSMIWATDLIGLTILLQPSAIGACFSGWREAVEAETGATKFILDAGYTATPMMAMFHADEEHYVEHCDTSKNGDLLFNKKYAGTNVHPYETIFMKTNRNVDPLGIKRLTEWHDRRGYSSYDFCGA